MAYDGMIITALESNFIAFVDAGIVRTPLKSRCENHIGDTSLDSGCPLIDRA